jgi:hypothetical protein
MFKSAVFFFYKSEGSSQLEDSLTDVARFELRGVLRNLCITTCKVNAETPATT